MVLGGLQAAEALHHDRNYTFRFFGFVVVFFGNFFSLCFGSSAWAAISILSSAGNFGSFCLMVSTGANRSPTFLTRSRTWAASKTSREASFFFRHFSTSSQLTGVETVGLSRARSEYTAMVVLWSSFWLQSTKTLPVRIAFFISETTISG